MAALPERTMAWLKPTIKALEELKDESFFALIVEDTREKGNLF